MAIRVDSPEVRQLVTLGLISKAAAGAFHDLSSMGLNKETIDALQHAKAEDVPRLARAVQVEVVINQKALAMTISMNEEVRQERTQLEYFVSHGASTSMLNGLFPTATPETLKTIRERLGISRSGGRIKSDVSLQQTQRIFDAWESLPQAIPERDRFISLHQQFPEISLATLFSLVMEAS